HAEQRGGEHKQGQRAHHVGAINSLGVQRHRTREDHQGDPGHELHGAVPVLQRRQFECGTHDAERGERDQAAAQQLQRVSPPRVAHWGHGSCRTDKICWRVCSAGLYLSRLSRSLARLRSPSGYGRYSTTSAAHLWGRAPPTAWRAAAWGSSRAVLADPFVAFGGFTTVAAFGSGSTGSGSNFTSAASLGATRPVWVAPPYASDTPRTA